MLSYAVHRFGFPSVSALDNLNRACLIGTPGDRVAANTLARNFLILAIRVPPVESRPWFVSRQKQLSYQPAHSVDAAGCRNSGTAVANRTRRRLKWCWSPLPVEAPSHTRAPPRHDCESAVQTAASFGAEPGSRENFSCLMALFNVAAFRLLDELKAHLACFYLGDLAHVREQERRANRIKIETRPGRHCARLREITSLLANLISVEQEGRLAQERGPEPLGSERPMTTPSTSRRPSARPRPCARSGAPFS